MSYIKITAKYLFLILLIIFCFRFLSNIGSLFENLEFNSFKQYLISSGVFLLLYLFLLRKHLEFWHSFFHELTHVLFAMLCLCRIDGFSVSLTGGVTAYSGRKNWVISLSPYFFPIISLPLMAMSLVIRETALLAVNHIVVLGYVFFLISLFRDFSFRQSDIRNSGKLFSVLIILILNILTLVFLLFYLQGDLTYLWEYTIRIMEVTGR